jgi:hypothetical protein
MSDDELVDGPDPRAETDVVQFGDDWPGIFIRGDNALYFALVLGQMVDAMPTEGNTAIIKKAVLDGLRATLASCDVSSKPDIVKLLPFAECLVPELPLSVGTSSSGERRAPVPAVEFPRPRPAGTVSWTEFLMAWDGLKARRGSMASGKSPDAVADEGGFTYEELVEYLGFEPKTWRPA